MAPQVTIRPPANRLDRRFILWRTLQTLAWAVGVLGALLALHLLVEPTRPYVGPILLLLGAIYLVNLTVMPTWRYLVHRWETTDDAVYALEGWLTRKWRIVPVSRIQSIDVEVGLIQNMLGLATLQITTASSEGKVTIEGLDAEVADRTARHLKTVTATTPGDAT